MQQVDLIRVPPAGALAPTSEAVVLPGGLTFICGQGPIEDGRVSSGSIERETSLTLLNLLAVVESLGGSSASVVRCTCYLANLADVPAFNAIYARTFVGALPARTAVGAALQAGMKVEVEAVAWLPQPASFPDTELGR